MKQALYSEELSTFSRLLESLSDAWKNKKFKIYFLILTCGDD